MVALNNPHLAILELVAQALGPVCDSVIFVGCCATGHLPGDAFSQQRAKPLVNTLRELCKLSS